MSFHQFEQPGQEPRHVTPISLPYSGAIAPAPAEPGRTLATVMAVLGIVVASLTLLVTLFKVLGLLLTASFGRRMPWGGLSNASIIVQTFDALAGLLLAVVLLIGSIGLLRLCRWSRRLLNWWGLIYLAILVLFTVLDLQIVVPDQVAMANRMFTNMPTVARANAPNATVTVTNSGATVTTWSTTMPTTAPSPASTVYTPGPPVRVPVVVNPLGAPQMASIMQWTYSLMAFGKAGICAIFPIVLLITLRLRRMRTLLGEDNAALKSPNSGI